MPIPVTIIGEKRLVHRDVAPQFVRGLPSFLHTLGDRLHVVEVHCQLIQHLQGSEHMAMSQIPLDAFQLLLHASAGFGLLPRCESFCH